MKNDCKRVRAKAERLAHLAYWKEDFVADRVTWSEEGSRILGLPPDERYRPWDRVVNGQ